MKNLFYNSRKEFIVFFFLLSLTTLFGQTKTYIGSNGSWNTASNWSPNGVPTATDAVVIPDGTVTISSNVTVKSISVTGTLKIDTAIRFTVNNDFTITSGGTFSLPSGSALATLVVYGNYYNDGGTNFWKSTVVIAGNLESPSTSVIQKQGNVVVGGNIVGKFDTTGGNGAGQIYAVNPNATVTITPTSIDANVIPGVQVTNPETQTLIDLVNSIIYGSSCSFSSSTNNVSACSGTNSLFSVTTTASSPTYQWQVNKNDGAGWNNLANDASYSGVTLVNLTIATVTVAMNNYKYRARVTSGGCSEFGNYGVLTVRATTTSVSGSVTGGSTICSGSTSALLTLSGSTGTIVRWESSVSPFSSWTTIANTSATYTSVALNQTTQFRAVFQNGTCSTATSTATTVTVTPNNTTGVASTTPSLCINTALTNITHTTSGATGIGTASGLPSGVTAAWASNTITISGTPIVSGTFNYSIPLTGGCGSVNASGTITVTPNLAASVSIASNDADNSICSGTSVTFTATPTNGGTPGYQWKLNGANVGTNSATYTTTTLATSAAVSVVMTSTATCVTSSPATSNTVTTTVNPNLAASVSIASNDADNTICSGTSVTFTATPTNGGTPSYQWKLNGANVGTNSATYTTTTLATSAAVSVVMTSTATCVTSSPATSNTITTTVNPNLAASVSIASNDADNSICSGTSVTFTATPTNGGTPSYQWKLNGANVGTNSATYTTTTLANSAAVSVVMTSTATCVTSSPATSNTITTTVNPNLAASVSIASNDSDNTICSGTSVTFTATPTNGGTPSYQWKLNGANVGTNSATYTTTTLANSAAVSVVMTSTATCVTSSPATSNTITTTVNPNLAASVSIASNDADNIFTKGTNVTLTATPTNGGLSPSYQWQLNGTNVGTNSSSYSTTLTTGQTFKVIMTSNASPCLTGSPATSNSIVTSVVDAPSVAGTVSSNQTICVGTLPGAITLVGNTGSIQWQSSTDNTTFTTIASATSATLSALTIGTLANTSYFRAIVTNGSSPAVTSGTVTISMGGSTTWNGTSWSNGAPTSITSAIISSNYNIAANINACSLTVNNNAIVIIPSGYTVSLNNALTVANGSSFTLENNSNLLQTSNVSNSGNIIVKRNTPALMREDYILWSSPVFGQKLLPFSPNTLTNRFYSYDSATDKYVGIATPSTTNFASAKGYLIRVPNTHPTIPTVWGAQFIGVPNNGTIDIAVTTGKYYAIGNPYPSPINADAFIAQNNITDAIYFWRKTNNSTSSSYATYTTAGGVANTGDTLGLIPDGSIAVGQGFLVKSTSTNLTFTNAMRIAKNNSLFLRTGEMRNRIWLNLTSTSGSFFQTMVSYMPDATSAIDVADGRFLNDTETALTSLINGAEYTIQGRGLPFDGDDEVSLSFKAKTAENYTISLSKYDGLFTNQDVFLKDNLTNTIHDLKSGPYTFSSETGAFNTRFSLVYKKTNLEANDFTPENNSLSILFTNNDNMINLKNTDLGSRVLSVTLYNLVGQVITTWDVKNENQQSMQLQVKDLATGTYVVKVTATKGSISKKIIVKNTRMTSVRKKVEKELPKERSVLADED